MFCASAFSKSAPSSSFLWLCLCSWEYPRIIFWTTTELLLNVVLGACGEEYAILFIYFLAVNHIFLCFPLHWFLSSSLAILSHQRQDRRESVWNKSYLTKFPEMVMRWTAMTVENQKWRAFLLQIFMCVCSHILQLQAVFLLGWWNYSELAPMTGMLQRSDTVS